MKAKNGFLFKRIHDGLIMGDEIILGVDYSTGVSRVDLPEYYEEIQDPECIWHENTNYQIKFRPMDLLDLLKAHKAMIEYTDSLTQYTDMMENVYFYVNYFNDMERELITYYGGIINEKD